MKMKRIALLILVTCHLSLVTSAWCQTTITKTVNQGTPGASEWIFSEADGKNVTLGSKADAKSTATNATPATIMQVLKEVSAMVQAPPSQATTNAGTFATQSTLQTQTD